jgi:hypothetical protein
VKFTTLEKAMEQAIRKGKRIGFPWHSKQSAAIYSCGILFNKFGQNK